MFSVATERTNETVKFQALRADPNSEALFGGHLYLPTSGPVDKDCATTAINYYG